MSDNEILSREHIQSGAERLNSSGYYEACNITFSSKTIHDQRQLISIEFKATGHEGVNNTVVTFDGFGLEGFFTKSKRVKEKGQKRTKKG